MSSEIQSQQQSPGPGPETRLLDIFVGKWMNEGYTIAAPGQPSIKITTSDVYEWMPGRFFVLHTAYGRIGSMDVGGTEILGYDPATRKHFSRFYDSRGNVHEAELVAKGAHGSPRWKWC